MILFLIWLWSIASGHHVVAMWLIVHYALSDR